MQYTETNPLNKNEAISEAKRDEDFNLFLVEVGVFTQDDTNTPFETYYTLVATEEKSDADSIAIEACERNIGLCDGEFFSQINDIEPVQISDYD